ncbi:MAG: hypothetical protein Q8L98_00855 [Chlamydiales bacterium]|nr:hypothetical protein [Chlamydiales bacterium]
MIDQAKAIYGRVEKSLYDSERVQGCISTTTELGATCFSVVKENFYCASQQPKRLHDYLIQKLTDLDQTLDHVLPNWIFQSVMDQTGESVQNKINDLSQYLRAQLGINTSFNEWLNSHDGDTWYKELAIYAGKLPLKGIYQVVSLLRHVIEISCYSVMHPLKALGSFAKYLIDFIYSFALAETWCVMGASMASSSVGRSLISGNPLFLLGIGLGGALFLAGLSAHALQAATQAKEGARLELAEKAVGQLLAGLPAAVVGSLVTGFLIGKIQRLAFNYFQKINRQAAEQYANDFLNHHPALARPSVVNIDPSGEVILTWHQPDLGELLHAAAPDYVTSHSHPWGSHYLYVEGCDQLDGATFSLRPNDISAVASYGTHSVKTYQFGKLKADFAWTRADSKPLNPFTLEKVGIQHPGAYSDAVHPHTAFINHMKYQEIANQAGAVLGAMPAVLHHNSDTNR